MVSERQSHEVEKCDAEVNVEGATEAAADEAESKEEECLISLEDDAEPSAPAEVSDATECHVENDEGDAEGDIPSDCPSQDMMDADAVASDDHTSIQEGSAGKM